MQQLITGKKLKDTFPAATKIINKCIKIYMRVIEYITKP